VFSRPTLSRCGRVPAQARPQEGVPPAGRVSGVEVCPNLSRPRPRGTRTETVPSPVPSKRGPQARGGGGPRGVFSKFGRLWPPLDPRGWLPPGFTPPALPEWPAAPWGYNVPKARPSTLTRASVARKTTRRSALAVERHRAICRCFSPPPLPFLLNSSPPAPGPLLPVIQTCAPPPCPSGLFREVPKPNIPPRAALVRAPELDPPRSPPAAAVGGVSTSPSAGPQRDVIRKSPLGPLPLFSSVLERVGLGSPCGPRWPVNPPAPALHTSRFRALGCGAPQRGSAPTFFSTDRVPVFFFCVRFMTPRPSPRQGRLRWERPQSRHPVKTPW